ncbi:metal-sensitive transcriptional regulator [Leptospira ilyithenensis]|uniref:Metal-sensitive transcriptional regulator n=1 Tax=Leptospira ilyithenensis TaxID=2484901 RepID=A0A4R9LSW4_9LEPT|nr:metal-sensitive transcriptional regulator [Leptospira ilyithenensis]TGN10514.1 metal-sensitive transcriptional regulator [Leptospira ilyithenensis]
MALSEEKIKLIHRLNRIQGQLEAIKNSILNEEKDCEKALLLLKASHQAMKKFGEAYVLDNIETCFDEKKSMSLLEADTKKAIRAAFSL